MEIANERLVSANDLVHDLVAQKEYKGRPAKYEVRRTFQRGERLT